MVKKCKRNVWRVWRFGMDDSMSTGSLGLITFPGYAALRELSTKNDTCMNEIFLDRIAALADIPVAKLRA